MKIKVITWLKDRLQIKNDNVITYGEENDTNFFPVIDELYEEDNQ